MPANNHSRRSPSPPSEETLDYDTCVNLARSIARLLDDCARSVSLHPRNLKQLSILFHHNNNFFFFAFKKAIARLFDFPRKSVAGDRASRFVASFAAAQASRLGNEDENCSGGGFLEEFLRFLLVAAAAAHRSARLRACQIVSEIIMRLPDDAEVSDVWDEVIESMKQRVGDKVPAIRAFAVRALSRFANDEENSDILDLFIQMLSQESNADVRKTIIISLPTCNSTLGVVVDSTRDVSESVRRAVYYVLATKFPLQSLSIKHRTTILQRGLSDRSASVMKECLKMLKDEWLTKCCNGDHVVLLQLLDVETYESVGEIVMDALLKDGSLQVQKGSSMRQFLTLDCQSRGELDVSGVQLMEAEVALYWKSLCKYLLNEAHVKGSDAANTTGAEAAVYASEASASNDLLEGILPATISDYVDLVRAHLSAGPHYRFASRQLLLLGALLDFSDITNRKVASAFVQGLLLRPLEYEVDNDGNKVVIGDGINLGGDVDWARAVSELARRVHALAGEFEEVVACAVEELACPCRERTADAMQWMHCLALTGLLLENIDSLGNLQRKAIEPSELLHSLLLPGVKQTHVDVQIVATRCLGLFGLLETRPSEDLVKQLRLSFISGPPLVSIMAAKALLDLAIRHGPHEVDKSTGLDLEHSKCEQADFDVVDMSDMNEDVNIGLLDLLFSGLSKIDPDVDKEYNGDETVHAILAEGFAKFLLLSESYPSISKFLHPIVLGKLLNLFFSDESDQRLKQCLSVFFEHYPALSFSHKKCVSRAFVPVIRSMWPGIYGNSGGSTHYVSKMRKRAVQVSRFMLQMLQTPVFSMEDEEPFATNSNNLSSRMQSSSDFECGEEGLAIRIACEVASCSDKMTPAERAYISALCKILVLLEFRPAEQEAIKCFRGLLGSLMRTVYIDKELLQELNRMAVRLKSLDEQPEQELSEEQANVILGRLGFDGSVYSKNSSVLPPTPAPCATRNTATRRKVRREASSDDEECSSPVVLPTPSENHIRTERASKTAAMSKMSQSAAKITESDEEEEDSGVTSDETSDES